MKNFSRAELKMLEELLAYCSDELNSKRKQELVIFDNEDSRSILNEVYYYSPTDFTFKQYIRSNMNGYITMFPYDVVEYFYNKVQQILWDFAGE